MNRDGFTLLAMGFTGKAALEWKLKYIQAFNAMEKQLAQRPLRAQTAQGERVSLVNSEEIPAGRTCEFDVILLDDSHEKVVREWLDYGILRGIGQWRNSGKGRFTYTAYEVKP